MEQINITLTGQGIQDTSTLSIHIAIEAMIEVDAKTTQRNVTRWLVSEVGNMLIGHTPHLVMNPQPIWRIPAPLKSVWSVRLALLMWMLTAANYYCLIP